LSAILGVSPSSTCNPGPTCWRIGDFLAMELRPTPTRLFCKPS
jgi:hypothetical protein